MTDDNTVIVDGQVYGPGDEIWDLGNWEATDANGNQRSYEGLSTELDKLPHYVDSGSSAICLDTGDFYMYHKKTDTWYKL